MRIFISCTLQQIQLEYQIKKDEMGGACCMHGGDEK
jgi:hypothetical protein